MEYMANAVPITLHGQIQVHFQRWVKDLRRLISEFHNRGLVHGDLRDVNIISGDDGCVKLVDFDWGGKDDEVSYPTPNLNPDLTKGRSSEGLRITKADDLRILSDTLTKTSAQISPCLPRRSL
jgi:tRNA A-37 threonylcarbamoyl transferase component Bud32